MLIVIHPGKVICTQTHTKHVLNGRFWIHIIEITSMQFKPLRLPTLLFIEVSGQALAGRSVEAHYISFLLLLFLLLSLEITCRIKEGKSENDN